eukprot:5595600-Alexandrium_andersonii.AAC.1
MAGWGRPGSRHDLGSGQSAVARRCAGQGKGPCGSAVAANAWLLRDEVDGGTATQGADSTWGPGDW